MALQPKLLIVTLASLTLIYALAMITYNSFNNCKEETEKLLKQKRIWIPMTVGVSLVILSFMMTSKFSKTKRKAVLAAARGSGALSAAR